MKPTHRPKITQETQWGYDMRNLDQVRVKIYGREERIDLFLKQLDLTFTEVSRGRRQRDYSYKDFRQYLELDPTKLRQKPIHNPVSRLEKLVNKIRG